MSFASLRRSVSDRVIYSSEDATLCGSSGPRLCLRSLGLSPGRSDSTAQSSSTISVRINHSEASFFSVRDGGGDSSAAVRSPPGSPPAYRRGESSVPGLLTRGEEEGGSKGEITSTCLGRKSLRESEPIPMYPPPVATNAATSVGDKKGTADPLAVPSAGVVEEKEYVWANNYRPSILEKFICNKDRAKELLDMVNSHQCTHLIFEGPPGVGKRTMALATLRNAFGSENLNMRTELKKFELKGEYATSIEVSLKVSSMHVEVNLTDLHGYEKHVLDALMSEPHTLSEKHGLCDHTTCRVVVVHDADKLSTDAQHFVCWLMEKYQCCNRAFFCCSEASKLHIIEPLCKIVKLQPPSNDEIIQVLKYIAREESIDLPDHMAKKFAENSKNNLRQAIRSFEASWKSNYSVKENQDILTGWEDDIAGIAKDIIKEQSPRQLYIIHGKLKNLIEYDISADFIFSSLIDELKKHMDEQLQAKTEALYQKYKNLSGCLLDAAKLSHQKQEDSGWSSNSKKNVRYVMRIEEFTAKFMSFYKSFITKNATRLKYRNSGKQCF